MQRFAARCLERGACGASSASVGVKDYSQVAILDFPYKSVNFGMEMGPVSPDLETK